MNILFILTGLLLITIGIISIIFLLKERKEFDDFDDGIKGWR